MKESIESMNAAFNELADALEELNTIKKIAWQTELNDDWVIEQFRDYALERLKKIDKRITEELDEAERNLK